MDPSKYDDGSRGELLAEYHWVAGQWRGWLGIAVMLLAAVAAIEVARYFGHLSEWLRPLEGAHATAKPIKHVVSFVTALWLYFSKTSFHLNALQVSWRTTPVPLFPNGAIGRSDIAKIELEKFPGIPEFMARRGYSLSAVLRSGEKRYLLHFAAREPALEIGQLLAQEMKKPGPTG